MVLQFFCFGFYSDFVFLHKTTWLPLIFNFNINPFAWVFESQIKQ